MLLLQFQIYAPKKFITITLYKINYGVYLVCTQIKQETAMEVRDFKQKHGLTWEALAEMFDVTPKTMMNYSDWGFTIEGRTGKRRVMTKARWVESQVKRREI